jgi:hypothetical protein
MVIGAEQARDLLGVGSFVQRGDVEADRSGLDRLPARFGHQRDHARRIDPAREERPERHVGDHPAGDRFAQVVQ